MEIMKELQWIYVVYEIMYNLIIFNMARNDIGFYGKINDRCYKICYNAFEL